MLVLQWRPTLSFDRLVEVEELVDRHLRTAALDAAVDGHDSGSGECNIFIHTNQPKRAFKAIHALIRSEGEDSGLAAAYRRRGEAKYTILWPLDRSTFRVT